ncbi:MAG TPA: two-component regulator propeller domain-containing protein [Chitinophagaceae bacterium]|nr:two-component regulator propeller domain-containing protein [Chitinophagaceae bacterium]
MRFRLLVYIILIARSVFAQPYPIRFQHLSIEQGLSYNEAFAFTQDKYGLVWIATPDGLNRFDGYKVEIYRHEPGNKNSLPDNMVRSIFTDSRGVVWVGTSNGLAYYDLHTNSFHSFFKKQDDKNSLPSNWISVITEDTRSILWIGTPSGLCSFDAKNNHFQQFLHDNNNSNSISDNDIRDIQFIPDGTMWITTGNDLNRLDLSTMRFTSFFHDPADSSTLSDNSLAKMAVDKNGNPWTFLRNTLSLDYFNTKTNRCQRFPNFAEEQSHIPSNYLRTNFIDRSERLWIRTNAAGLHLFSPEKNFFYQYRAGPLDPGSLQANNVVSMFQDRSGLIWLSTSAGVERFNPDESKFRYYKPKSVTPGTSVQAGLTTTNITANSVTLNWGAVANADKYTIAYKQSTSSSWIYPGIETSSLSYNLVGLSAATSYDWQVSAVCSANSQYYGGGVAQGSFTTAVSVCSDAYETNNTSSQAKAITSGIPISASISSSTDVDWFKITTPNNSNITLQITLSNLPADYDLYVYNKNLVQVGASTNTGTSNELVTYDSHSRNAVYYVKVTGKNGVYNTAQCYNLLIQAVSNGSSITRVSPDKNEVSDDVSNIALLYPNPASELVHLHFNSFVEEISNVQILNSVGQLAKRYVIDVIKGYNQVAFSVKDLRPGIYVLKVNTGELNLIRKFVIAR